MSIYSLALKSFFSKPMLRLNIIPFVLSILIFLFLLSYGLGVLLNFFSISTESYTGVFFALHALSDAAVASLNDTFLISYLMGLSFFVWLTEFFIWLSAFIFLSGLSFILSFMLVSMFITELIVKLIHKESYSQLCMNSTNSAFATFIMLCKSLLVTLVLFILLIPFYFIPVLNTIALSLPLFYFFQKSMLADTLYSISSTEQAKALYKQHRFGFLMHLSFLYLLCLIPFVGFFLTNFALCVLTHFSFQKLLKN